MSAYGRLNGGATSPNLSGKTSSGERLSNRHHHTHFVPQRDRDRIESFVVWSPSGFTRGELVATSAVKILWTRWSEKISVEIRFTGNSKQSDSVLFSEGEIWRSVTPFVLPLHPRIKKGVWKKAPPDQQIARELKLREMPEPLSIRKLSRAELDWQEFNLWRGNGNRFGYASGYELGFGKPIKGPLLLGYGSHYGLGHFLPTNESVLR